MRYIIERFSEPSTFAGIAAFLASLELLDLTESQWNEIFGGLAVLMSVIAIFFKEGNGS